VAAEAELLEDDVVVARRPLLLGHPVPAVAGHHARLVAVVVEGDDAVHHGVGVGEDLDVVYAGEVGVGGVADLEGVVEPGERGHDVYGIVLLATGLQTSRWPCTQSLSYFFLPKPGAPP